MPKTETTAFEVREEDKTRFHELLEKYDYGFKKGDVVSGVVVGTDSHGTLVDIGAKMNALLPGKEAKGLEYDGIKLQLGDRYEFFILREENEDGFFTVSLRKVQAAQTWKQLEDLMTQDAVIECQLNSLVKGGFLVDILGLRGFVPLSHIRARQPFEQLVGTTLPFKILSMDQQRSNIILSHRKVVSEQLAEQRRSVFDQLEEGCVIEGDVVRLTDFGAFVDLGGIDGLLPLSQMSWRWVEHPSDVLAVGDKVRVEVIGIDFDRQRVSLSIKSLQSDPWQEIVDKFQAGTEVDGTITRLKHFGAFVEIFTGVEALLPAKDVMHLESTLGKQVQVGDAIKTWITRFNPDERRISLGLSPDAVEAEDSIAMSRAE